MEGFVYKSTDAGLTWKRIWLDNQLARYILIDIKNTDRIFVSTGIFDREAANANLAANDPGGVGILRSLDGGKTWKALDHNNGLDRYALTFGALTMHPTNPDSLMAASKVGHISAYGTLGGFYRTADGGDSWTEGLRCSDHGPEVQRARRKGRSRGRR